VRGTFIPSLFIVLIKKIKQNLYACICSGKIADFPVAGWQKMKIAYLILAHNNYNHLRRLVKALNGSTSTFFIHIDKKSEMPDNLHDFENVIFVKRSKVWWSGWSIVDATLRLMRVAVSHGFDYYILLSGTDYPIRPNSFLYEKLSTGNEYINIIKGF
jgi:hypothetical protein